MIVDDEDTNRLPYRWRCCDRIGGHGPPSTRTALAMDAAPTIARPRTEITRSSRQAARDLTGAFDVIGSAAG